MEFEIYDSSKRKKPFWEEYFALLKYKELIFQFISQSIKTRYKRSFLGLAWTMLNPLLTMLVLTLVFSQIFRFDIEFYSIYLLTGLLVWNFFSSTTKQAMVDLYTNGLLLRRIYMPKTIFAIASLGNGLVNLFLSLVPLFFIALFLGVNFNFSVLLVVPGILILSMFTLGIGLILSTAAVYFPDMLPFYDVLLMIWMYATPIIYPISIIPNKWIAFFQLNPLVYLINIIRKPIFSGIAPNSIDYFVSIIISMLLLIFGWWLFTSRSKDYAYRI